VASSEQHDEQDEVLLILPNVIRLSNSSDESDVIPDVDDDNEVDDIMLQDIELEFHSATVTNLIFEGHLLHIV
jgi:hypothetical protein